MMQSDWVPPLLRFLSLYEDFPSIESSPHPGSVALRILSISPRVAGFDAALLLTLASILSPDHPLQSRKSAMALFCRYAPGWLSSQMENVPDHRLNKLLQAVGDPFHFPPEPPQDEELERTGEYKPMEAVVVLVEFASSKLWRSHLRPSNFVTCEDILSTGEGRRTVLQYMLDAVLKELPEFLCTAEKVVATVRHLEELGLVHTAQVVVMWAWVTGMADVADQDGWQLIEDETLRFYQAYGIRFLASLKQYILDENLISCQTRLFAARYEGPPFRVRRSRRPSKLSYWMGGIPIRREWETDRVTSQTCRLRRLYHLFGYDPATWQEAVGIKEASEERRMLSEHPVMPDQFVDWGCDYA